jgi:2-C-methyl-D-erythritol 4-phosphate cytidylyltransferase
MKVTALIVAGGKGSRMKEKTRKQYLSIAGSPLLVHTLRIFSRLDEIQTICLVVPEADITYCHSLIFGLSDVQKKIDIVAGGNERQDSVYNGICGIRETSGIVVIHDGVRPFVSPDNIRKCIREAEKSGACILGVPASDTLKRVDAIGTVHKTVQRDSIWLAQTPQAFTYSLIKKAHEQARADGFYATDDASLVEYIGHPVKIVSGSKYNIKITTREDLLMAESIIKTIRDESGR